VSAKHLASRWPWFNAQVPRLLQKAKEKFALETSQASTRTSRQQNGDCTLPENQFDHRITPHSFDLAERYEVTWALLRYFYTLSVPKPCNSRLPYCAEFYCYQQTHRLQTPVKHAMLSETTCDDFYEPATRCDCQGLQFWQVSLSSGHIL